MLEEVALQAVPIKETSRAFCIKGHLSPPGRNQGHSFWTRQTWPSTAQARPGLGGKPQRMGCPTPNFHSTGFQQPDPSTCRSVLWALAPPVGREPCGWAWDSCSGDHPLGLQEVAVSGRRQGFLSEGRDPALPSLVLKCDTRTFRSTEVYLGPPIRHFSCLKGCQKKTVQSPQLSWLAD